VEGRERRGKEGERRGRRRGGEGKGRESDPLVLLC